MNERDKKVHPYIPNSVPEVKAKMMKDIGITDIEELYKDIPEHLRFKGKMNLPDALTSEYALKRHVEGVLSKNLSCKDHISFLGGGCWQHYVPAICDEINQRSEFLTAYAGEPYEDHGRFQSLFEYESLMAELLDMDVVNVPTYDWCQAAATAIRMAGRITGRNEILVADTVSPERLAAIRNYCHPVMNVRLVKHCPQTGIMDLEDMETKTSLKTAGVYFENPSFLGFIEHQGELISEITHKSGAISIVGVDPVSLGVIRPPSQYGADIVCGDIQCLGVHMFFGGGLGGFIASRDEEKYVMEYPSRLFGITKTAVEGEYGFGDVAYERTSFAEREEGKEFVGTHAALWGITAAVYLSLMGPQGMQELNTVILQKSHYLMKQLSAISGVRAPYFKSSHFKEFVVDFNETGKTVKDINTYLRSKKIFGGKSLRSVFPELGESALYCVTEIHTKEDLDSLIQAIREIVDSAGILDLREEGSTDD
ncbi:MAG: aminomethyl-transferring glycine dehydrogenase subunit GcvPA [Candidatus Aminicenantes bacterium]|nr:aminomethyl-transferring glycine dehydrogenase subunit GcvPA [Candidatus Aminicenantes bacterium]